MKRINYILAILLLISFAWTACELPENPEPDPVEENENGTGNLYDEEIESLDEIPKDLSIVTIEDVEESQNNSSRVMLTDYVPPVRSQGAYGTCCAWGCGYYTRTIMYARENDLSPADLESDDNVFSPKFLFNAIPDVHRGDNCWGAWPGAAFQVMQSTGIATFANTPYDDLGDCSQGNTGDAIAEAASYKIENFRVADHTDIQGLKTYLAMGRPVQISCALGLNFSSFVGDEVMYGDDYSDDPAEHGRHAMCLVGYDDNKGDNGAFRIVNSWGTNWGDEGFAWIDYNYFVNTLVYSAYVIEGDKGGLSESMIDENVINPSFIVDGKDFITVKFMDEANEFGDTDRDRTLTYNVFNKGSETIPASADWNIIYYYYNAYDPENDFGVLIYDYYTDDVGSTYQGQNGDFSEVSTDMREYGAFNWWNYVDVPSGYSVATAVEGDGYDYDFEFDYELPDISGEYYLVLMADGFNDLDEQFEQNNFIFFTGDDREPLHIENGVIQGTSAKDNQDKVHCGVMKDEQPNAYSLDEIKSLMKYQKRTGKMEKKAMEHRAKLKSTGNNAKRTIKAVLPRTM